MVILPGPPPRWRGSQKFLHWLMAALIVIQIGIGAVMEIWKPKLPAPFSMIQIHKSVGFTLLVLVVIRLLVRWRHGRPPLPDGMPLWERWLSNTVHGLLYAVMVAMPLVGWFASSAAGYPTRPFGLFTLPDLIARNRELAQNLGSLHGMLAFSLVALMALHIAGALKHHFVNRDDVLRRMLPGRSDRLPELFSEPEPRSPRDRRGG